MDWTEVTIETCAEGLDHVCARLTAAGFEGLVIEDPEGFRAFVEENGKYWDSVDRSLEAKYTGAPRVKLYLPAGEHDRLADVRRAMAALREASAPFGVPLGSLAVTVAGLPAGDWETAWQKYYKPTAIGKRLLIVPEWEPVPETGRVVFLNNPGLAFGTGTHASTHLALELIEAAVAGGERVLDVGCGSGILGIAAILLGAESADALDIDPLASETAEKNAALNGIADAAFAARPSDILADGGAIAAAAGTCARGRGAAASGEPLRYDLVVMNIVADVILRAHPQIPPLLAPGGRFLISGVIDARRDEVLAPLEASGFVLLAVREREGWIAALLQYAGGADK